MTNLVLTVVVAASVSPSEFGAFSVLLIVYTLSLGTIEGLIAEVFTVVYSVGGREARRQAMRAASGCAVAIGLIGSVATLGVAHTVSGPISTALPPFALILPALYLQDVWRFAFFALGRPSAALVNDLTWAFIQFTTLVLLRTSHHGTLQNFVLAWGAGAIGGALLGMVQVRLLPRPWLALSWVRRHWSLGGRFAGEFSMLFGSAQIVFVFLGVTAGLAELGALRAGQVIFAPLQGLLNAVRLSVTSLAVEARVRGRLALRAFVLRLGGGLGIVAVVCAISALVVPTSVGRALLGDSWPGAHRVLLPLGVMNALLALSIAPLTALRASCAARRSFRGRMLSATSTLFCGGIAALTGSSVTVAWGLAIAASVGLALMVGQASFVLRGSDR